MLALLLLTTTTGLGVLVAQGLRAPLGPYTRLGVGASLGQLWMAWGAFALAATFDLSAEQACTAATLTAAAACAVLAWRTRLSPRGLLCALRAGAVPGAQRRLLWLALGFAALVLWLSHTHYLRARPDGLYSAGVCWGDLPIHLGLISRFAEADGLARLEHPLYLGGPLGYPFVPDYAVAVLVAGGLSLHWALVLATALPLLALLPILHGLAGLWSGRPAVDITWLAIPLFLFAGGWGFMVVLELIVQSQAGPWAVLASNNATYFGNTFLKSGHLGNLFIAARTASLGMPAGAAALLLLGHARVSPAPYWRALLLGGATVGLLPLVHPHSFLVLCGCFCAYALLRRDLSWPWLACGALLLSLAAPQLVWLSGQGAGGSLRLANGFLRGAHGPGDWALDVLLDMGLWLWLVPAAFVLAPPRMRLLGGPLLLLLPVANLIVFTPTLYDNVKLLAWFDVAASIFVATLLLKLARGPHRGGAVLATVLALGCTLSGLLAVGTELAQQDRVFDAGDLAVAEQVKRHVPPGAVVASAGSYHDPVSQLAGRRTLISTPRMLPSHGIRPHGRARDVVALYAGGPPALEVIERVGVDVVVVGPRERRELPRVDEGFLRHAARRVVRFEQGRIYFMR